MSQSPEWLELTRLWQAEGAAVSVDELEQHRQREHAAMRALAAVELAGLGLGIVVGIWMSIASPFIWVSSVFIAVCVVMGWVAFRRNHVEPLGGEDLLTSLRIAMAREDWVAEELRFGRALSFVVSFVIVYMTSYQMHNFASASAGSWLALAAAAAWICGVLAWNVLLLRRSARRRQRLESYATRLEGHR